MLKDIPIFPSKPLYGDYKHGLDQYQDQLDKLTSAILIDDYKPHVQVDSYDVDPGIVKYDLKFPKGSLISGSFLLHTVVKQMTAIDIGYDDIDIYIKSKEDAMLFIQMNGMEDLLVNTSNPMCIYLPVSNEKINLIYGVEYDQPSDLISYFDIRACSMALDMNEHKIYMVNGAIEDALSRRISFNPTPRTTTVRRLVKYINKGFSIDPHQSLFFAELIKAGLYSPELELITKGC